MVQQKHVGDLTITAENAELYKGIAEVTGSLYIRAGAQLPVLTSVGGYLDISADAQLPVLTSVGGYLDISAGKTLTAPRLETVSGHALPTAEEAEARIRDVAAAALASDDALNMGDWHTCGTTHCIAGWGVHLAGADGYKLEKEVEPAAAGAILLGVEAAHYFYTTKDVAAAWLRTKVGEVRP